MKIDDELIFDVQGVPIKTTIASLRTVDWKRFQTNFFVLFPAGVLETAPKIAGRALLDELREAIDGGSRRPFPASITTDEIERRKIQRFFPLFP